MPKNPCFGCQDREVGCHSKCPKYIEFAEANKKRRTRINNNKQGRYDIAVKRRYNIQF